MLEPKPTRIPTTPVEFVVLLLVTERMAVPAVLLVPTTDAVVLGVAVPIPIRLLVPSTTKVLESKLSDEETEAVVAFGIDQLAVLKVSVSAEALPRIVLPSVLKFPSTSRALRIFVVPVAAAITRDVAAPPRLSVVAVVFTRLNVVALVVISPPLTARSSVFV